MIVLLNAEKVLRYTERTTSIWTIRAVMCVCVHMLLLCGEKQLRVNNRVYTSPYRLAQCVQGHCF